jgi:anti-sigma regulatory factor (Ser/Thr protein kinase)
MLIVQTIEIRDIAHVGFARRAVHEFAKGIGFPSETLAELDIVVQEIGTNAVRYATDGAILHIGTQTDHDDVLELIYMDRGPGIHDIDRVVRDGVSTSGGLGAGIGAIRRLTDEFEVYSTVMESTRVSAASARRSFHGTAILVRKRREGSARPARKHRIGVMTRPRPGESENGDAWYVSERGDQTLFAVVDGLGHGYGAHEAASAALEALGGWQGETCEEVVRWVDRALKSTRGAVIGIAIIDTEKQILQYTGVGNIETRILGIAGTSGPISNNGMVGQRLGTLKTWTSEWRGGILVMTSDGLSSSWTAELYPGLLSQSPQMIACVLMRDLARESDDATVLVAR